MHCKLWCIFFKHQTDYNSFIVNTHSPAKRHTLIKTALGFVKYLFLATWKNEGYADFIAKETSFKFIIGMYFICNSQTPSSPSFEYFKYRLYIDYLINTKKLSFSKIANSKFNLPELDKQIQIKYCDR